MKLTLVSHSYQNERYESTLKSMSKWPGVDLTLICPETYKGERFHWKTSFPAKCIPMPVWFGSRQGAFVYDPTLLGRTLDETKPDIILHEQEAYAVGASQVASAAVSREIPYVLFVWENLYRIFSLPRRLVRRYVLRKASGLIAGSCRSLRVHRDWGFQGPGTVIPQMGVTPNPDPSFGKRGAAMLTVCFVGRLLQEKGIDCLIQAIALLRERGYELKCTIVGDGPEFASLRSLARRLRVEDRVEFAGHLSGAGIRDVMRRSDVLALPSRKGKRWEEQFGRVLPEAMAEATVAVGSRTGAIPEVIGADELLFDEGDHRRLAGLLERLAIDESFLIEQQKRAWSRAKHIFDEDNLTAQRIQFLSQVLEARKEGPSKSSNSAYASEVH